MLSKLIKNGIKCMNSFKERSWNPKYELGHQSKRKTPNKEAETQKEKQDRKCVKHKGNSEETEERAWKDKAANE
jgi:hypothetical protein